LMRMNFLNDIDIPPWSLSEVEIKAVIFFIFIFYSK